MFIYYIKPVLAIIHKLSSLTLCLSEKIFVTAGPGLVFQITCANRASFFQVPSLIATSQGRQHSLQFFTAFSNQTELREGPCNFALLICALAWLAFQTIGLRVCAQCSAWCLQIPYLHLDRHLGHLLLPRIWSLGLGNNEITEKSTQHFLGSSYYQAAQIALFWKTQPLTFLLSASHPSQASLSILLGGATSGCIFNWGLINGRVGVVCKGGNRGLVASKNTACYKAANFWLV